MIYSSMMPSLSPYWKWDSIIPTELLDLISLEVQSLQMSPGNTFSGNTNGIRDSNVCIVSGIHWFAGILSNYATYANIEAGWARTLIAPQHLQFASYEAGQFYNWHTDTQLLSADPINRKLTAICLLNDTSEFNGGILEIENSAETIDLKRGSVIVFPSILRHRVTPVTSGKRVTATCWINGPASW